MHRVARTRARHVFLASFRSSLNSHPPLYAPCPRCPRFVELGRYLPSHRPFATMPPIERVTDKLDTPALDDRSYRVIRLPNKLEALLVHDPDTDKASASVNVNVGSFSDADDMPGMAHAVEHLLFMGTEKVCLSYSI